MEELQEHDVIAVIGPQCYTTLQLIFFGIMLYNITVDIFQYQVSREIMTKQYSNFKRKNTNTEIVS